MPTISQLERAFCICHYRKTIPKAVNFSEVASLLSSTSSQGTSKGSLSVLRQPVVGDNETCGHAGAVVLWSVKQIEAFHHAKTLNLTTNL